MTFSSAQLSVLKIIIFQVGNTAYYIEYIMSNMFLIDSSIIEYIALSYLLYFKTKSAHIHAIVTSKN